MSTISDQALLRSPLCCDSRPDQLQSVSRQRSCNSFSGRRFRIQMHLPVCVFDQSVCSKIQSSLLKNKPKKQPSPSRQSPHNSISHKSNCHNLKHVNSQKSNRKPFEMPLLHGSPVSSLPPPPGGGRGGGRERERERERESPPLCVCVRACVCVCVCESVYECVCARARLCVCVCERE